MSGVLVMFRIFQRWIVM